MSLFKKKETFLYEKLDGFAKLMRYGGSEPDITVADSYEGVPVTEIAENAFYDAGKVEHITLPDTIKTIGTNAFRGCKSLKSVVIPDGCTSIADYAFTSCKNLESVKLPAGITELPEGMFSKTGIKEFRVPDSVTKIGEECFAGCSELASLDLGNGVTEIGKDAFKNCSAKFSVVLPKDLTITDHELLEGADMIYRRGDRGLALLRYGGHETSIVIPDKLGEEYITAIGPQVFYMFAYLSSITLPSHLLYIGEQAFAGCSGLTELKLPDTMEFIGKSAFTACGPRNNRPGYMARKQEDDSDTGITEVTLPASLKTVDDMAFAGCSRLSKVTILGGNTQLGGAAFLGCPIESIVIPEGITELQAELFRGCGHLKSVTLPSTLESIWQRAFVDCDKLESITLPDNLQVIAEGAFMGCVALKSLTIPARVREIQEETFAFDLFEPGCLTVAEGNENFAIVDNCLIDRNTKTLLAACVADGASVTVPECAENVGSLAFAGSPISEFTAPAHVKKIAQWALRGSSVTRVTVLNPECELGNGILLDTGDVDVQPDGSPVVDKLLDTANKE